MDESTKNRVWSISGIPTQYSGLCVLKFPTSQLFFPKYPVPVSFLPFITRTPKTSRRISVGDDRMDNISTSKEKQKTKIMNFHDIDKYFTVAPDNQYLYFAHAFS